MNIPTFSFQGPQKFTQIWIFGLKTYHLATLVKLRRGWASSLHVGHGWAGYEKFNGTDPENAFTNFPP
jgi:hypothetical protein